VEERNTSNTLRDMRARFYSRAVHHSSSFVRAAHPHAPGPPNQARATLKPRPPFQVLIMSEESRLGREAIETAYALKQLITAGVRVFFYLEDRERTFDSPTDKLLMSVTAFADELERQKAALRVYDAMQRKARAGHVCGGRVFGYDNLEVLDAKGDRSHVERRVNEVGDGYPPGVRAVR
jgi:DNA invertase Pin-like site-specific DNA recombinase